MSKTLGPVALKLGNEVLVKIRTDTTIKDLLEQLDKACNCGRIQDADGFDVTAHYSQDLPEGGYAIKQPTAGGPIAAAVRGVVSSMHANLLTWQTCHNIIAEYNITCMFRSSSLLDHTFVIIPIAAGVSQAVSPVQQDFVSLVETLKVWMPMLQAQILQQNYQASVSGSGNSQKRKQEQQDTFRLQLHNYYFDKSARILPTKVQCMITRQSLQAADMVGAHTYGQRAVTWYVWKQLVPARQLTC